MLDEVDKLSAKPPRRSVFGSARGAGSGTEQLLPRRPPRRCRDKDVLWRGAIHRLSTQCARIHSGAAARPWKSSSSPATPKRKSCKIAKRYLLARQPTGQWSSPPGTSADFRGSPCAASSSTTRAKRESRSLERQIGALLRIPAVVVTSPAKATSPTSVRTRSCAHPRCRAFLKTLWRCAPASRAWRPASPGLRPATTSVHRIQPRPGAASSLGPDRTTRRGDGRRVLKPPSPGSNRRPIAWG